MIDLKGYYELDKRGIQDSLDAIPINLKRKEVPIVTTLQGNFDTAEKELVSQALIEWRHGFADPRPILRRAIELTHRAVALLPEA